ncbi:CoA transferase [Acidiferrimicrobium sp. IK]|uniref:CaiB/BaiF CoA transferase family protein n=1 Tax=Acidiferrimicrobium sp. IK TaxID=2871700 RepID=UPI0021CB155D|nr:CoA transferase [Acidiferrimicrobium sp. IK]MCU4183838.1 CoA transferase [Acidiferrimicrobium sp. IK]
MSPTQRRGRPVFEGLKVVEFAHVIAGPLAGTLLADLGAEIVHVEDPSAGDPSRQMGPTKDNKYLWWKVSARNKRSITLNLRSQAGQDLARRLAAWADVVITNFRVGTLEKWGLDWPSLHEVNPKLVMLQVSGHGTNTTARNMPGFGKVGESMSGVVNITGFPDGPPVHTGFSHADTVTALMGAYAISAALTMRDRPDFDGEWIDLALFESLFRLIEWQVIIYDQLGIVPQRAGNQLAVAPGAVINTYLSSDNKWITVTSATPRSVQNVAALLGLPLEEYETVPQQLARRRELDDGLRDWVSKRPAEECLEEMKRLSVVAAPIYDIAQILEHPTIVEREDVITVEDRELGDVRMQAVVPKMMNHPGKVWRTGPFLGEDNDLVYREYLHLPAKQVDELREKGTI